MGKALLVEKYVNTIQNYMIISSSMGFTVGHRIRGNAVKND